MASLSRPRHSISLQGLPTVWLLQREHPRTPDLGNRIFFYFTMKKGNAKNSLRRCESIGYINHYGLMVNGSLESNLKVKIQTGL